MELYPIKDIKQEIIAIIPADMEALPIIFVTSGRKN